MPDAYDHQRVLTAVAREATMSSVNDTASSTTLLAANVNRRLAVIVNDSTSVLYVLYGSGTASATNFSYRLEQNDTLVIDDGWFGQINGIWSADASGAARITELT